MDMNKNLISEWMKDASDAGMSASRNNLVFFRCCQVCFLLEYAAATRRTSGQTDVFVSMFVCSSDARS